MTTDSIQRYSLGMLPTNAYLIDDRYLIDPGGMNGELEQDLRALDGGLQAILLTHAHWDHIQGIGEVREIAPDCRVLCHSREQDILADPEKNFSTMRGGGFSYEADGTLDQARLPIGTEETLQVLETPGHSPGSVSFYWESRGALIAGDALFKGSIGRTDVPGGDSDQLLESLGRLVENIPPDTRVYPGHGPATSIREELQTNPFLQEIG